MTLVIRMRSQLLFLAFLVCCICPLHAQQTAQHPRPPASSTHCDDQSHALDSGVYVYSALDQIWPPDFPVSGGITIAVLVNVKSGSKLFLHTDGSTFELWMGTAQVPKNNVWTFLRDVADSCRLPRDPGEAVRLLNVRWEVKAVQQAQFQHLHGEFLTSLAEYASTVRERSDYFMATGLMGFPVDASKFEVIYDNSRQHFKIDEWDLPIDGHTSPIIKWVHELQGVAEEKFHASARMNK